MLKHGLNLMIKFQLFIEDTALFTDGSHIFVFSCGYRSYYG